MAFLNGGSDCEKNNKQHLNLSIQAREVLEYDRYTFGCKGISTIINRVFQYYAPDAQASVSLRLNCLRGQLARLLLDVKDEKTKKRVTELLLENEKCRLLAAAGSYEKGIGIKFWLNNKNLSYLTEPDSECHEEQYYEEHRGKYIKSVLEEYARLPYVKRERVYFSPFIQEINTALRRHCQLRVRTGNKTSYSVYPHGIFCDPLSTANYLVGFSKRYDHPEDNMRPCSFRISALDSIKAEKSKSAFLKEERRKELSQIISSRGVQFMSGGEEEVCVRLTEAGKVKLQRQIHLRPVLVNHGEDVFVFRCTAAQAEFYFFKFGADAEILKPAPLRERFKEMYERAFFTYRDNDVPAAAQNRRP